MNRSLRTGIKRTAVKRTGLKGLLWSMCFAIAATTSFSIVKWNLAVESPRSSQDDGRGADVDLFTGKLVPLLEVRVEESAFEKLESEERPYVRSVLKIAGLGDEQTPQMGPWTIGVKLKGAAGSYQGPYEKPGLTVRLDKFRKGQSLTDPAVGTVRKFHLNNAVQDETYFHEWLGTEVFRMAGYPAPSVSHAVLQFNDFDRRLVVVREGYDEGFIKKHVGEVAGNLYDGGFCQDIEQALEKDAGDGPEDHSDLRAIVEAMEEPEFALRLERVAKLVDLDRFLTFMAIERLICHWDGYSNSANNYRLFVPKDDSGDSTSGAVFLPHGMDQLFGDLGMDMFDPHGSMLARHVMSSNELRSRYRERVREVIRSIDPPERLLEKLQSRFEVVVAGCGTLGEEFGNSLRDRQADLVARIRERIAQVNEQIDAPEPLPLEIAAGESRRLEGWYPVCDIEEIRAEVRSMDSVTDALHVSVSKGSEGFGSWRAGFLLAQGHYKIRGRYKVNRLRSISSEAQETLLIATTFQEEWSKSRGQGEWQEIELEFQVIEDQRPAEVLIGIRSKGGGELWVDQESFRIERIAE